MRDSLEGIAEESDESSQCGVILGGIVAMEELRVIYESDLKYTFECQNSQNKVHIDAGCETI